MRCSIPAFAGTMTEGREEFGNVMELHASFSYPFRDPDWFRKVLLAGLILLIPVVGALVILGWELDIIRRVIRGSDAAIPSPQPGIHLRDGLRSAGIFLLYLVPLLLAFALLEAGIRLPPVVGLKAEDAGTLAGVLGWIFGVLCVLLALGLPLLAYAAIARFADSGRLKDAFRLRQILPLVAGAPAAYLPLLPGLVFQFLAGSIGVFVCCFGLVVSLPYGLAVQAHWIGQAYIKASAEGNRPPEADSSS